MWPEEETPSIHRTATVASADRPESAFSIIGHRLRELGEGLSRSMENVQTFLGRCGRGGPPNSGNSAKGETVRQTGHIGDIDAMLNELESMVSFLRESSGQLERIG